MANKIYVTLEELMDPKVITNIYLYGQKATPSKEELANEKFIGRKDEVKVTVNKEYIEEFMKTYGRFANASKIKVVQRFFNEDTPLMPGIYSREKFAYGKNKKEAEENLEEYIHAYQHIYFRGNNNEEWARRTYILNSQGYAINKFAKFIVTKDGERYIENLTLLPLMDNFDFSSKNWLAILGNYAYLEDDIDPYRIGKRFDIEFPSSDDLKEAYINNKPYTRSEFEYDQNRHAEEHSRINAINILKPILNIVDGLWESGVTKFIDDKGKVIIYGTNNSETISGVKSSAKHLFQYYLENQDKGVTIIGGKGDDKILGTTSGDDTLYSSGISELEDNASDTLKGFGGFDTYIVGDKDIIEDSDGKGRVLFDGVELKGGIYDKNKDAYIGSNQEEYKIENKNAKTTTLTVTMKNGKKLTIMEFDKNFRDNERGFLGIVLKDDTQNNKKYRYDRITFFFEGHAFSGYSAYLGRNLTGLSVFVRFDFLGSTRGMQFALEDGNMIGPKMDDESGDWEDGGSMYLTKNNMRVSTSKFQSIPSFSEMFDGVFDNFDKNADHYYISYNELYFKLDEKAIRYSDFKTPYDIFYSFALQVYEDYVSSGYGKTYDFSRKTCSFYQAIEDEIG